MITYQYPLPNYPKFKLPVLHKVVYNSSISEYEGNGYIKAYPLHDAEIEEWCRVNCKSGWYLSPSHSDETFIEFEDDEEAVVFALMWG